MAYMGVLDSDVRSSKLISLQNAVCFSLPSWKLSEKKHF